MVTMFQLMVSKLGGNLNIVLFLAILGIIVVLVTKAGGSQAYCFPFCLILFCLRGKKIIYRGQKIGCALFLQCSSKRIASEMTSISEVIADKRNELSH